MQDDIKVVEPARDDVSGGDSQPKPEPTPKPKGKSNKSRVVMWVVVALLLIAGSDYLVYAWQHNQVNDLTGQNASLQTSISSLSKQVSDLKQAQSSSNNASTTPTNSTSNNSSAKTVKDYKAAALFYKCQMNDINATGSWGDSTASVTYADFNGDGVQDVLAYAKIPGTAGYTMGCVYTISNDKLSQLWRLADSDHLNQSTMTVNSQNQIVYTGYKGNATTKSTATYTWSASLKTFVKQ